VQHSNHCRCTPALALTAATQSALPQAAFVRADLRRRVPAMKTGASHTGIGQSACRALRVRSLRSALR
jgi:hypothetical protein